jgi:hypothetical protein
MCTSTCNLGYSWSDDDVAEGEANRSWKECVLVRAILDILLEWRDKWVNVGVWDLGLDLRTCFPTIITVERRVGEYFGGTETYSSKMICSADIWIWTFRGRSGSQKRKILNDVIFDIEIPCQGEGSVNGATVKNRQA